MNAVSAHDLPSLITRSNQRSIPYTANSNLFRNKIAKLFKEQLLLTSTLVTPDGTLLAKRFAWACSPMLELEKSRTGHGVVSFDSLKLSIKRFQKNYVNSRQKRNQSS